MAVSVLVVVLGDIGHSPRMQQHVQELVRNGYEVDCLAYRESTVSESLASSCRFHLHPLPMLSSSQRLKGALLWLHVVFKVFHQLFWILWICLFRLHSRPKFILNQNPPAMPVLLVLPWIAWVYKASWIVDWHNFGYSIMAMSYGPLHPLVRLAKWLEYRLGRFADAHLTVTKAMKEDLVERGFKRKHIVVCYDHPPIHFSKSTLEDTHELFLRLLCAGSRNRAALAKYLPSEASGWTPFTKQSSPSPGSERASLSACSGLRPRSDRPVLLMSSTSWTIDEDFGLLIEAIDTIEGKELKGYPKTLVIISGKGPMKESFMAMYEKKKKSWKKFAIIADWFEYRDYAKLLGSADLGLCFHCSSSGLDFPMKVVDMLGCSLPVLALDFPCSSELLKAGKTGDTFASGQELAQHLIRFCTGFPHNEALEALKRNCEKESFWPDSWSEYWSKKVKPLLYAR